MPVAAGGQIGAASAFAPCTMTVGAMRLEKVRALLPSFARIESVRWWHLRLERSADDEA